MKPSTGSRPIPLHRNRSNFQYLRNLHQGQPGKEAQFYDSALARVHFGEMVERLIEGEDGNILSAGHHRRVLEGELADTAPASRCAVAARIAANDLAHQLGASRKHLSAALPLPPAHPA